MTALSVNLNKIALLRNSRGRNFPDVNAFADLALQAGAAGVTLHPRPDERHARYSDVFALKEVLASHPQAELNIEGYPCDKFIETVLAAEPHQCTLVPDDPNQLTSDHGWDLTEDNPQLELAITRLQEKGIRVSLFIDPCVNKIELARKTKADRVELYTESWAQTYETEQQNTQWQRFQTATEKAQSLGFAVNAGHDLNLENLAAFLQIQGIQEVSIGHALIVESLHYGFAETIGRYVEIAKKGR